MLEKVSVSTAPVHACVAQQERHESGVVSWVTNIRAVSSTTVAERWIVNLIETLSTSQTGRTALEPACAVDMTISVWRSSSASRRFCKPCAQVKSTASRDWCALAGDGAGHL